MGLNKTPEQHRFENEVQKECDRIDELRASWMVKALFVFFILCLLYSLIS